MRISEIKVGYVVSYDFDLLLLSINQLYKKVDRIYIAIDKEKKHGVAIFLKYQSRFLPK